MTPEQARVFQHFFLSNMENELKITRRVIASVPQNNCDYRPDPKSMSGRELAFHIASADTFFLDGIINGKFEAPGEEPTTPATIDEILQVHETNYNDRLTRLKALSPEQLCRPISFFGVM